MSDAPRFTPLDDSPAARLENLFQAADTLQGILRDEAAQSPEDGSPFQRDEQACPEHAVHSRALVQLQTAFSQLAALPRLIPEDTEQDASLQAAFGIVRAALVSGAYGLWMIEPKAGTRRVAHRLTHQWHEYERLGSFVSSLDDAGETFRQERRELIRLAEKAGCEPFASKTTMKTIPGMGRPSVVPVMRRLEQHNPLTKQDAEGRSASTLPWSAVWQLASGLAHGMDFAELEPAAVQQVRRTLKPATGPLGSDLNVLATCLESTLALLHVTLHRYAQLRRAGDDVRLSLPGHPGYSATGERLPDLG